jgi:hypothetical protein
MARNPFGKSKAPPFGKEKPSTDTAETGEASAPEAKLRAGKRGTSTRNRKTSRR